MSAATLAWPACEDADWIRRHLTDACAEFTTPVTVDQERLIALVSSSEQHRHAGD